MRDYAFGNLVTKLRTELGFSQFQLGKLIGVSDKAVSKWENGNAKPRIATCCRLADILGVSLDELLSAAGYGQKVQMKRTDEKAEAELIQEEKKNYGRQDLESEKRIELHLMTGMSLGIASAAQYIKRAAEWGHSAIAVTDFTSVQSLPEAFKAAARKQIKMLPGCTGYMLPSEDSPLKDGYVVMLLATKRSGITNLNRLISLSHTRCYKGIPCMPRAWIETYREGLLIGSSCVDGEIDQDIKAGMSEEELSQIVGFYDYLEIEPIENVTDEPEEQVQLRQQIMDTIKLGNRAGIPVVAVSNADYLDPEDAVCRAVLRYNDGYLDEKYQPQYYLRTTSEMLEAFRFLGDDLAKEVVIDAPRRIADRVDSHLTLMPGDGKFYPVLPEAKTSITEKAMMRAHSVYGDILPPQVEERLKDELKMVERQESWTIFEIARLTVEQSRKDGYPVCSRGSVGSSFIAWLTGISEINPLAPHYCCTACHYADFTVDEQRYHIGADLPARNCPYCGKPMNRDGFSIPFEIFFGMEGEKEPDIDMNFSGEEQSKVHEFVRKTFGQDRVFCPGVIQMMSETKAERYSNRYFGDHHLDPDSNEAKKVINQLSETVKITEGKHPAGLYILPEKMDINEFTPVQFPGDDISSSFVITHHCFSMLFNTLLKMDFLGADTPTLLQLLTEFTGIKLSDIPLNDKQVLSLFTSSEAIGVTSFQILSETGCYGIPDFSNAFVQALLTELHPTSVEELIRILGMANGTGVWKGNAQDLIASETATCVNFPSLRDDIMKDLLQAGVGREEAYKIMHSVRMGKGLNRENEDIMKNHGFPEWYIEACNKILYLFPRAHSVAYAVAGLQIAWFKIYYPEAFYRAWFKVRQDDMEETDLMMGPKYLRRAILATRSDIHKVESADNMWTISEEEQRLRVLELILEMRSRGIEIPAESP